MFFECSAVTARHSALLLSNAWKARSSMRASAGLSPFAARPTKYMVRFLEVNALLPPRYFCLKSSKILLA